MQLRRKDVKSLGNEVPELSRVCVGAVWGGNLEMVGLRVLLTSTSYHSAQNHISHHQLMVAVTSVCFFFNISQDIYIYMYIHINQQLLVALLFVVERQGHQIHSTI